MRTSRFPIIAILSFVIGLPTCDLVAQTKDYGQRYAEMSDPELWDKVRRCNSYSDLQTLINQIPISVIAKRAENSRTKFGNLVKEFLWLEFDPARDLGRLVDSKDWKDWEHNSGHIENARIFDVTSKSVVLQKENKNLIEIPIKNLTVKSAVRVGFYQSVRNIMLQRSFVSWDQIEDRKNDLGQDYVEISKAELWKQVMNCRNRSELQSLISEIPMSVIANHAKTEFKKEAGNISHFGKLVTEMIWPDFDKDDYSARLSKVRVWQAAYGGFKVKARIFDVQEASVTLQKEDGSYVWVPIERLSPVSAECLNDFRRIRADFNSRLPADIYQLLELVANPKIEWPDSAAAILAIRSVNQLIDDGSYLLKAAGLNGLIRGYKELARNGSQGINPDLPFGTILFFDEDQTAVIFCLPVTNYDSVLRLLAHSGYRPHDEGPFKSFDVGEGNRIYAISRGGWAYFSDSKLSLITAPKDPGEILAPLTVPYTVSISVNIIKFPESVREEATKFLGEEPAKRKKIADEFLGRNGWIKIMAAPIRSGIDLIVESFQMNTLGYHNARDIIRDAEEFTLGWAVDKGGQRTFFDFNLKARKKTTLANRMEKTESSKSKFKGFVSEDAAFAFHAVADLLDEDRKQYLDLIEKYQDDLVGRTEEKDRTVEGKIIHQLLVVLHTVVESKKVDLAGSLLLTDDEVNLVAGCHVPNGPAIEEMMNKLIDTIESGYKDRLDMELNREHANGVTFHKLAISIPTSQIEARDIFGEKAQFVIGNGPGAIYVGVGKNAVESIKSSIISSGKDDGKELTGGQFKLALQPILKFISRFKNKLLLVNFAGSLLNSKRLKPIKSAITAIGKKDVKRKPMASKKTTGISLTSAFDVFFKLVFIKSTVNRFVSNVNLLLNEMSDLLLKSKRDQITASLRTKDGSHTFRIEVQNGILGLVKIVLGSNGFQLF